MNLSSFDLQNLINITGQCSVGLTEASTWTVVPFANFSSCLLLLHLCKWCRSIVMSMPVCVCVCVWLCVCCLSVCKYISRITCAIFPRFFVHVAYGRGSALWHKGQSLLSTIAFCVTVRNLAVYHYMIWRYTCPPLTLVVHVQQSVLCIWTITLERNDLYLGNWHAGSSLPCLGYVWSWRS